MVMMMPGQIKIFIMFVFFMSLYGWAFAQEQSNSENTYLDGMSRQRNGIIISMHKYNGDGDSVSMVVNDSTYLVSKRCLFLNQYGGSISLPSFSPGMVVNFHAKGKVITKIMISDQQFINFSNAERSDSSGKKLQRLHIYKEGRVWKN